MIEPKVLRLLVISNNPFSKTRNNGKTLSSFFKNFPKENIAQLYFSSDDPDDGSYSNYFRISDLDILKGLILRSETGVKVTSSNNSSKGSTRIRYISHFIKISELMRLFRELIWCLGTWNSNELNNWLDSFNPNVVFFCAGDSRFAYKINSYIVKKYNTKSVVYVTDDYILPRTNFNVFWWIRRALVVNSLKKALIRSQLFFTISEEMKSVYSRIFGKNSKVLMNATKSLLIRNNQQVENELIELVYAGGLHFKRYETLVLLGQAIKRYNKKSVTKKVQLKIYSTVEPSKFIKKKFDAIDSIKYCGSLNSEEIKIVLNSCDFLVHVESFEKKFLNMVRLSLSTKIPEYLSLGKPILAIGPYGISSMNYLKDSAHCIFQKDRIFENIENLFEDKISVALLSEKAIRKFQVNHDTKKILSNFTSDIRNLIEQESVENGDCE